MGAASDLLSMAVLALIGILPSCHAIVDGMGMRAGWAEAARLWKHSAKKINPALTDCTGQLRMKALPFRAVRDWLPMLASAFFGLLRTDKTFANLRAR